MGLLETAKSLLVEEEFDKVTSLALSYSILHSSKRSKSRKANFLGICLESYETEAKTFIYSNENRISFVVINRLLISILKASRIPLGQVVRLNVGVNDESS